MIYLTRRDGWVVKATWATPDGVVGYYVNVDGMSEQTAAQHRRLFLWSELVY